MYTTFVAYMEPKFKDPLLCPENLLDKPRLAQQQVEEAVQANTDSQLAAEVLTEGVPTASELTQWRNSMRFLFGHDWNYLQLVDFPSLW